MGQWISTAVRPATVPTQPVASRDECLAVTNAFFGTTFSDTTMIRLTGDVATAWLGDTVIEGHVREEVLKRNGLLPDWTMEAAAASSYSQAEDRRRFNAARLGTQTSAVVSNAHLGRVCTALGITDYYLRPKCMGIMPADKTMGSAIEALVGASHQRDPFAAKRAVLAMIDFISPPSPLQSFVVPVPVPVPLLCLL